METKARESEDPSQAPENPVTKDIKQEVPTPKSDPAPVAVQSASDPEEDDLDDLDGLLFPLHVGLCFND